MQMAATTTESLGAVTADAVAVGTLSTAQLADLQRHSKGISKHLSVIGERVPVTVQLYQDRLRQRMETLLAESGAAAIS